MDRCRISIATGETPEHFHPKWMSLSTLNGHLHRETWLKLPSFAGLQRFECGLSGYANLDQHQVQFLMLTVESSNHLAELIATRTKNILSHLWSSRQANLRAHMASALPHKLQRSIRLLLSSHPTPSRQFQPNTEQKPRTMRRRFSRSMNHI